nr:hypothetical protein [Borreliella garinii]
MINSKIKDATIKMFELWANIFVFINSFIIGISLLKSFKFPVFNISLIIEIVELRAMKIKIGILEYLIIIDGFFMILKGSFLWNDIIMAIKMGIENLNSLYKVGVKYSMNK